jgi:trigger factor
MSQMTARSPEKVASNIRVEDAGPCLKKVTITVPAATVADRLSGSFDSLALEAELPGFRRGRAPRKLVEKRFGGAVKGETKNQLVSAALRQAVEEHKLRVVGDPTSQDLGNVEITDGADLNFSVEIEVIPEFDLPALDAIEVKKPVIDVTDAMVDDELLKMRVNEGTLEERQNPEAGDYLTGKALMKADADGHVFYDLNGAVVQIPTPDKNGKGMILGVMVEDFAQQLGLPKAGDTATIKVVGPANHEVERLRGTPVTVSFTVDRIDRIIPADADKIAQGLGFEGVDALKGALRQRLQQRATVQQQVAMRQQIAKHLIDNTKMDLPQRLTAAQSARSLERRRLELMYRGFAPHQVEEHVAELRAASSENAARELKLFFILNRAADDLKVSVDESEMNARIAQMAYERNLRPEKLRQEIIQRGQAGMVFQQIREHKTMDAILGKAKVTEVPADEFNKTVAAAG